jgi:starch synthase
VRAKAVVSEGLTNPTGRTDSRRSRSGASALKILHVASEFFPLVKTGGLADVAAALPRAQRLAGLDARMLLPGLPGILDGLAQARKVADLGTCLGVAGVRLISGRLGTDALPAWVIDAPLLYRRPGNPYQKSDGLDWPDNLQRFGLLGWVAAQVAGAGVLPRWRPDVVHAHDWHAGMACAYLHGHANPAASVFTVHNLAYQGLFAHADGALLGLSSAYLTSAGLEYHGQLSFMKAGLKFADRVTTVSPTYAREIATPEYGHGLDGVIRARAAVVSGILNGIDTEVWNPSTDTHLACRYDRDSLNGKLRCKAALQAETGLQQDPDAPLLGALSRLTPQKGLDLLLEVLPRWLARGGQFIVQGNGDAGLAAGFRDLARQHPGRVANHADYDEARAHRLVAGADLLAVPSRFEPCGLTQMYALRYGTLPVVRRTGGLADTVSDPGLTAPNGSRTQTGFVFDRAEAADLDEALDRARAAWRDVPRRQELQRAAMTSDFGWAGSAARYAELYRDCLTPPATD